MVDVVGQGSIGNVSHGVGVHHLTVHRDSIVVLRDGEDVAVLKDDVIAVIARIFYSFVEVDTDVFRIANLKFVDINAIARSSNLEQGTLHGLVFFGHLTLEASTFQVGLRGHAATLLDDVREA